MGRRGGGWGKLLPFGGCWQALSQTECRSRAIGSGPSQVRTFIYARFLLRLLQTNRLHVWRCSSGKDQGYVQACVEQQAEMRLSVVRSFRFVLFCRLELRLQFGKLPSVEVLAPHQGEQQVIDRALKTR